MPEPIHIRDRIDTNSTGQPAAKREKPAHIAADLISRAVAKRARRAAKPDASAYARSNVNR